MSDKPQSLPQQLQQDSLQKALNKLSVKFNANAMLNQEVGESLGEFINLSMQTIGELKSKVVMLEVELVKYKPKEEKKVK